MYIPGAGAGAGAGGCGAIVVGPAERTLLALGRLGGAPDGDAVIGSGPEAGIVGVGF